jgi:hypothetical protein
MTPADILGEKVWDVLAAADIKAYHRTGDGFDIVARDDDPSHVVVVARCEGALFGTGPQVGRQMLGRWIPALERAGYAAELLQYDGDPLGLVVAVDEPAMRRGVELALASVVEQSTGVTA